LNERVNFAVNEMADLTKPGIREITEKLSSRGATLSPEEFVDSCLDLVGPMEVGEETRAGLVKYAAAGGGLGFESEDERMISATRVGRMLQLIVASREYQFA